MGVFLASFLTALCVSALCSLAESVLLSLSTAQIAEIKEKNRRIGEIWEAFKKNVDAPITSILAVNTAAHTIGASLAGAAFAKEFGDSKLWVFSAIFTFLMLQYTEILPKTLGVRYNKRFAFWVARPLWFATKFGAPIIKFIRLCNKPFEPKGNAGDALSSVQELRVLTLVAEESEQLDEEQADVILEALDLNKTTVREIMTPIEEAKTVDAGSTLEDAMKKAIEDGHTRFPVANAQGGVEKYVNFKELARGVARKQLNGESFSTNGGSEVEKVARELLVVSPDAVASEMLTFFVDESQHIAVVRDEKTGENVGILTLEDLLEELVGEIKDEFDCHNRVDETEDALICGGGCELAEIVEEIEKKFPGRCAEAVEALKKNDAETIDESNGGWETRRLNAWFRSRLPKAQKKILRSSSLAFGDLRIDAHNVQYGQLKEAEIRLRDGVERKNAG
ncbi:MAG: DUF21 domain-containing protein [Thermoguttaceae bacterium]|nr:DUF21 domain-containing protein [Thermoguttaceae bacterium]